ncbi:hypothetical protein GC093_11850 [Paenibacillus sp. LMG 31456]|uniref:Uncharacterized protein n=1 Tax=Paenibacillus foliorum TaxID=2654974 RepID=A0A972GNF1_9BACL|nr:peptidylprolyl isomerase [Paenibacillus foliorum]NOU93904.1 hypothetical protein [Paenibacillus foliorum]
MKRKNIILISAAAIILLGILCTAKLYTSNASNNDFVFTVDGIPVANEEFYIFYQNNKAMTANYFKTKYNIDYSAAFWTSTYNGENPSDYAKHKAIDELKKFKIEQLIMQEHKIIKDLSFDHFTDNLDAENKERRRKIENKEPVYGLTQFNKMQYYSYLHATHYANMINSLMDNPAYNSSDSVYREYYERQKHFYSKGFKLEGQLITTASPTYETIFKSIKEGKLDSGNSIVLENLTLNLEEISKEELTKRSLYEVALKLNENEFSEIFPYNNVNAIFKLTKKQSLGYKSFDDVKSDVKKLYINDKIQEQITDRLKTAKVIINQPVYDKLMLN